MTSAAGLTVLLASLTLLGSAVSAPAGQGSRLVAGVLGSLRDDVNRTSAGGRSAVQTQGLQESAVGEGGSAAAADPGKGGLSATIGESEGGAGTGPGRAESDGTALIGSIAVNDGRISTSTAIVSTRGDSDKGTEVGAIGLTSSEGRGGTAKGVQFGGSRTGPATKGTSQTELTIGSSVADVGTQVSVAGGSEATRKEPVVTQEDHSQADAVKQAKRLLALSAQKEPPEEPLNSGSKGAPVDVKVKVTPKGGQVKVESLTESQVSLPGPSHSAGGLQSTARSADGRRTSQSAVFGASQADPGPGGISASVTTTDGAGRAGTNRAGTNAVLLTGSIALNDGRFSTSTGIVRSSGDTAKGTKTDALALTNSVGPDGAAHGVQHTAASTGSSQQSSSAADVTVGSRVGDVGSSVNVGGGTQTTKS
ncbi:uncharacterized protein LOC122389792 isoform X2 [Amphibalanus amphitrite]|uniref:uncharacterized protein LOC122389792 isoform X2 n=1 Tax=Amphibalanus amphitrite TaxID=1232801 RepID=UPI001C92577E|nr:uncharacterized protein LOC122389792 isoform X2 [Amphibalanus amphitrite]